MFTGIVEKVGTVSAAESGSQGMLLRVASGYRDLALGESVAVNGVCLTVTESSSEGEALFFVSQESLSRTNLGSLARDSRVNLERALALGARLSGHIVQGHVDGLARILALTPAGESRVLKLELAPGLSRYCIEKGSIAVDGVSLTLNSVGTVDSGRVSVALIPHTWEHTTFHACKPGDAVNIEVDLFAKYVERIFPKETRR